MPRKQQERPQRTARFVWFVDGEPEITFAKWGPNRDAAELVVARMESDGAIRKGDEALVMAFLMLADAIDHAPTDARLWGQYRDAESAMRVKAREAAPPDAEEDWTSSVGAATVRNTKASRPRKPRAPGGRGVAPAGQGADAVPAARVGRRARGGG